MQGSSSKLVPVTLVGRGCFPVRPVHPARGARTVPRPDRHARGGPGGSRRQPRRWHTARPCTARRLRRFALLVDGVQESGTTPPPSSPLPSRATAMTVPHGGVRVLSPVLPHPGRISLDVTGVLLPTGSNGGVSTSTTPAPRCTRWVRTAPWPASAYFSGAAPDKTAHDWAIESILQSSFCAEPRVSRRHSNPRRYHSPSHGRCSMTPARAGWPRSRTCPLAGSRFSHRGNELPQHVCRNHPSQTLSPRPWISDLGLIRRSKSRAADQWRGRGRRRKAL